MRWAAVGLVALVAGFAATESLGANLFVDAFKHSEPFYETGVQVMLPGVGGVTGVSAVRPDGAPVALSPIGVANFSAVVGPFGTFGAFDAATVGTWELTISFAGGDAGYDFVVNDFRTPFTESSFAATPTMTSPTDGATGVAPTPTFNWDAGGSHTLPESLFVSVFSQVDPSAFEFDSSSGGINLGDTSWTPSIALPGGAATFLVQYETNENEDANVDDPVFDAGESTVTDPGITWDSSGDLFSRDLIDFTVIPEPATAALVLGGLAAAGFRRARVRRDSR